MDDASSLKCEGKGSPAFLRASSIRPQWHRKRILCMWIFTIASSQGCTKNLQPSLWAYTEQPRRSSTVLCMTGLLLVRPKWSDLSLELYCQKEDLVGFTCIPNEQFSICSLCKKPFSLWATNVGLEANLSLHHMPSQPSSVCSQTRYQPISVTKGYLFAIFKV